MKKQNTEISRIVRQLTFLQSGGNWLEENFDKKLKGLDAADAFEQPMPGVHSIAEIVWHCIYWRRVNIERMSGNPGFRDATLEAQNFLPLAKLKELGWPSLLDDLEKSFKQLIGVINDEDDSFLMREYEPDKSFGFILYGTIEHDAYHLGQIGLVTKILHINRPDLTPVLTHSCKLHVRFSQASHSGSNLLLWTLNDKTIKPKI